MSGEKLNHKRLVRGIAKGAGIVFFSMLLSRFLGFVIRAIIGRVYGPEGYGHLQSALALFTILSTIALLGFSTSIPRQIAYYLNTGKKKSLKNMLFAGYSLSTTLSLFFGVLLVLFSEPIALHYFHNKAMASFINYFGVGLTFYVWLQLSANVYRGLKKMVPFSLIRDVGRFALILFFLLILIWQNFPVRYLGLVYLCTFFLIGTISTIAIFSTEPIRTTRLSFELREVKALFRFSWPLVVAAIVYKMLFRVDTLMIAYFKSQADVGIYNAAVPIGELLTLIITSFSPFLLPAMTEKFAQNDYSTLDSIYSISTKWIYLLTVPLFSLIFFFPRFFILVVFGKQFAEATLVLQIIALGYLFSASVGPANNLMVVIGRTKLHLINTLVSLSVNVILNFFLIQKYGIFGGAIATAFSYFLFNAITLTELWLFYKIQPFSMVFTKITLVGIGLSGLLSLLYEPQRIWLGLLIFIIYFVLYITILKLSNAFDENDEIIFIELEKKYGQGLEFIRKFLR
ncbi:MAG: flippase [Candidatus Marinimicrobia bacterium]|nr:flippase [Candidatus Neomarinimicrobiota bacterium]MCF7829837.1 flippase [Candidatus Neomarinimicrobiota bacterium]MCF7881730.1 flippase [Candidatus Neomarinimicrobiota bacterium]MCF8232837.1 flippase [Bacteroidales bacterium]